MDVKIAAQRSAAYIDAVGTDEAVPFFGKAHLRDMVQQIEDWDLSDSRLVTKAHRWLGWLQCAIVMGGGATLDQMKQINKDA